MAKNLLEILQSKSGYQPLQKVDPNTQDVEKHGKGKQMIGQAVVPAVFIGFYKFSREEKNAQEILDSSHKGNWPTILFGNNISMLSQRIAAYAGVTEAEANRELVEKSDIAADLIREETGKEPDPKKVKDVLTAQRNHILHSLPASLSIGYMIDDNTVDDNTNKMEGPVSSTMHKIEQLFAGSDNNPEEKKKNF